MKYIINIFIRNVLLVILSYFLPTVSFQSGLDILYFCIVTSILTSIIRAISLKFIGKTVFAGSLSLGFFTFFISLLLNAILTYFIIVYYPLISVTTILGFIFVVSIVSIDFSGMET